MALGREVGDAYISVHGDLSDFRNDLNKANKSLEDFANKSADSFADAWGKRTQAQLGRQWDSIVDAMHSRTKMDFNRMIKNFDLNDLDAASEKIHDMLNSMRDAGKLTEKQFDKNKKSIDDEIKSMQRKGFLQADLAKDQAMWDKAHLVMMSRLADARDKDAAEQARIWDDAAAENERWARTMDGMRKNSAIRDMNGDFEKLAQTMKSADFEDFAKGFDTFTELRKRVYDVTAAMQDQGRMSAEQAAQMRENVNLFIRGENDKSRAMRDTLNETNRLRKAQDDYNSSLSGMARNFHFGKMEDDFRNLARAMDSNDFSHFAKGADNIRDMRLQIANTANEMRRLGRMTDHEYLRVLQTVKDVNHAFGDGEKHIDRSSKAAKRMKTVFTGLNKGLRGTREHLQGFAGLNVFGDMIGDGLDFIHNLDRIGVKAGRTTLKIGSMASIGGASIAGLAVIAGDLGTTIGGLAVALPAFFIGAAIQGAVLKTALQDMQTVLKDLAPAFHELQDSISKKFWDKAADPIRSMVKTLLPTLTQKLNDTATAWGGVFAKVATAIKEIPKKDIETMFDRMNSGIEIAGGAMKPLIEAFTTLGLVGSEYFTRFGQWIVDLSNQFNDFIQKAAADGRLKGWIDKMIEGFKDIGRSLDGVFGIFNAIEDAARKAGAGGLKEFADKLQGIAKAMQEKGFQDSLTMLFSGMLGVVEKIGGALRDLGPAIQSVMPSVKLALGNIGDSVATIIGYIGQILSNPLVQRGITDFTGGIKKALETLKPAMKPFADSVGNVMTLLGKVVVSVAKLATAFTVELAPVLDSMSIKVQELLDPLSDMAVNVVKKLRPVADAMDKFLVGPIVAAMKSDLIPAFNGFVDKAGPVLAKIVEDLGPTMTTLVKDVLPNAIKFAGELLAPLGKLFDLFTPAIDKQIKSVADGFDALASALRIAKGEARTEDWGNLFGAFTMEGFEKSQKAYEEKIKNASKMDWPEILGDLFSGNGQQAIAVAWNEKIWPWLMEQGKWIGEHAADGLKKLFSPEFWDGVLSNNMDFSKSIGEWLSRNSGENQNLSKLVTDSIAEGWANDQRNIGDFEDTVNKWFDDSIFHPIRDAWDNAWKGLEGWWDGVKSNFQDFMSGILGFNTHPGKEGVITGGGGAGGKGTGVSGKLDPAMFGLPTEEGVKTYFGQLGTDIRTGFMDAMGQLGEALGLSDFGPQWDGFWAGVGTTVSDAWTNMTTFISTKYTEISTNVTQFLADFGAGWDEFWANPGAKIAEVWQGMLDTIAAKNIEISTGITTWFAGLKADWDNFWKGVGDKLSEVWNGMGTWLGEKQTEIGTAITVWADGIKTGWDEFWTGVGDKVSEVWENITTWLSDKQKEIGDNLNTWIEDTKTAWAEFWDGAYTKVSEIWEKVRSYIATKAEEIRNRIVTFASDVKAKWDEFWAAVYTRVSEIWERVRSYIATKAEEIRSRIATFGEDVKNKWNEFWTAVGEKVRNTWDFVKMWISNKAEEIRSRIANWANDVKAKWDAFWTGVGEKVRNTWDFVKMWISNKAEEIRSRIANWANDVKARWDGFWTGVGEKVRNTWDFVRMWIFNKAEEIRSRIANFGNDVRTNWNNFWNDVSTKVTNIWNDMKGAVERKSGEIIDFVRGMPQKITGQFSNMWGEMERIGGSIWKGLKAGIDNGIQWVTDAAKNLAANAIRAAEIALDINSPSKVFRSLGLSTGEGFVQGIDRSGNSVNDASKDMATLAIEAFAHSKMYLAGQDAALGLADGLTAKKAAVLNALGNLTPDTTLNAKISGKGTGGVGTPTPGETKVVNVGGITLTAPVTNPEIAAHKVVDLLINNSSF